VLLEGERNAGRGLGVFRLQRGCKTGAAVSGVFGFGCFLSPENQIAGRFLAGYLLLEGERNAGRGLGVFRLQRGCKTGAAVSGVFGFGCFLSPENAQIAGRFLAGYLLLEGERNAGRGLGVFRLQRGCKMGAAVSGVFGLGFFLSPENAQIVGRGFCGWLSSGKAQIAGLGLLGIRAIEMEKITGRASRIPERAPEGALERARDGARGLEDSRSLELAKALGRGLCGWLSLVIRAPGILKTTGRGSRFPERDRIG